MPETEQITTPCICTRMYVCMYVMLYVACVTLYDCTSTAGVQANNNKQKPTKIISGILMAY